MRRFAGLDTLIVTGSSAKDQKGRHDHKRTGSNRTEAFAERMIGVVNDEALVLMTSIGHGIGLFGTS